MQDRERSELWSAANLFAALYIFTQAAFAILQRLILL
jgi:hypothetical protein